MRRGVAVASLMLGACTGAPAEPDAPAEPPEPQVVVETPAEPVEAESLPQPLAFTPATRGPDGCKVTVSALLEAEEYRGPGPMTPAVAASLDADPEYARMYNSESHGDHHIQCVFLVELGHEPGKKYRWREYFNNVLRDRTPEDCKGMAAEVAEDIVRTTKECTDLEAGAYWGYVLEVMQ
jgi:hypothetical protein